MEESLRKELVKRRLANGWTQEVAAQRLGVSRSYLACIESGVREPSTETLKSLHRVYRIGVKKLLGVGE